MDLSFPTLYKQIESMYVDEFGDDVFILTENVYREEILKLFGKEEYDDSIEDNIFELYKKLETNENIITLVDAFKTDKVVAFTFLFSYDYFYLFYPCLKDILEEKPTDISPLLNLIG